LLAFLTMLIALCNPSNAAMGSIGIMTKSKLS